MEKVQSSPLILCVIILCYLQLDWKSLTINTTHTLILAQIMTNNTLLFFLIILLPFFIYSCNGPRQVMDANRLYSYECQEVISIEKREKLPEETLGTDTLLRSTYTYEDLLIANAFGLIPDLRQYEQLKKIADSEGGSFDLVADYITVSNKINQGLDLAALELRSVGDLIDCTIIKLRKYRSKLAQANLKSQNRLSNWAIITGAATTVLTAGILVSNDEDLIASTAFDWMAVLGGIATGYLAIKSAKVDKKIRLSPQKNFIRAIKTGENNEHIFPHSTWYLMNQTFDIEGEALSPREYIIREWKVSQNLMAYEDPDMKLDMLSQPEEIYSEGMIDLRIELLETIGVGVDQLSRALYILRAKQY